MTDWSKYKIQDDTPKKSKWDQYKIEEPSKKKEDSESTSTLPVSESKEQLSTPVVSHSGFRTVREKGTAQTPGIAIEKTPTDVIVFDEQKEIEEFEKQRELSQLNVKEKYATIKPQLDELKQTLTKQKDETDAAFNYARTTLEELKRAGQLDNTAPDVAELSNSYSTLYKQTQDNDKALRNIKDAELFVEDLEKVISGKNKKFSEGASQTFLKKIAFDGIAEIKRNYNLKNISGKLANNEDITEDERLAISTYGLLNEAQANFPSGIGYDVGRGLVEMVPYLASFAASGGASKVIQQGLMQAMKSTGAKTTQEMLKKGLAYVSGQAVRPAFFTSLYSQGLEKQIGQVETTKDLLPSITEGTKESPQKAFAKAYANTLSEVMTEQLGEVAVPIFNKIIGKEVKQVLNPTMIDKIKDATAFNGFLPEMGEEFYNEVLNTAIEGRPVEEIFDPRKILTTALTVGIMSSGFALSNTAYREAINKKEQESGFKFDTKTKKQIDAIIESDKDTEEKAKELSYIVDEKIKAGAKNDEISNIVQYATSHTAKMKLDEVEPEIQKGIEKKAQEDVKIKSESKVPSEGITSLKEEETIEKPKEEKSVKEGLVIGEKVESTPSMKRILSTGEENVFTRTIEKDGAEFGEITIEEKPEGWQVKRVDINEEKKGYGKSVYRELNNQAQKEGKVIISDLPDKISGKAKNMWESLVKSGEARKNNDGSYQMFPSNMIKIVNDLKSGRKTLWHNTDAAEDIIEKGFYIPLKGRVEDIRGIYVGDESTMNLMYQSGKEFGGDFLEVEFKPKKPFIVDNYKGNVISEDVDFEKEFNGDAKKIEKYVKDKGYDSFINIDSSNGNIDEAIAFDPKILNIVGERKLGDKKTKKIPRKEEPIVEPKITEEPTDASRILKDEGQVQEGVAEEVPKETVGSLLEKEEQNKKEESGFLPFVLPLSIFQSPRAKRKAVDIKQVLREQFLPSRGMPQSIYKEFVKSKGKVNARKFDIQRSFKQMTKDLYDAYGEKITPEQKEAINTALENLGPSQASRNIAFNTISKSVPVEARGIVERMRNDIDAYTEDLKKLDMIGVGLEGKMDANTGYYVTRTYKKHTDRDWTWEKIPIKIKEDAANKLMEVFGIEADEALGMAKEMLETPDLTDYVIRKGNSLADIDKRSLNKRSVFLTDNPEIRKLLGENRDPLYNYAMSMTRMAEMIEKGKMLENIRDIGLAEGILSEKPSFEKNHVAQIKYNKGLFAGKPGTKQLADYYTTPEIAKSINSFMDTSSPSNAMMRAYMKLITSSKIAKTALSIKGLVRNFQSNIVNALANGNWDLPQIATRLKQLASNKDTWTKFTRELYEQNIIGDSANAGELIRNVEDLSNRISTIEKSDETLGEKGKRLVIDNALKLYGFADDVWKVYRYISEKGKYQFAFEKKGYSPQEAEQLAKQKATEILHKTSTYYSELPPIIQNMRKLPFTNTFVSFPYLTTVNFIGTVETAVREMKDPATMFIGLQRMGGAVMSLAALAALSEFRNREEGQDEKDMEAWRRFLPDFWKNDLITITEDNGNGTAEYNNTSYLDYYNAITSPMMLLRRRLIANGEITTDDIIDSAEEFSKSFLGWDIIFNKLTQVKANEDELGRQIFNPQDEKQEIYKDIMGHIWEGVEPGTITDARRIYKSYREGGEWQKQMIGTLTGRQTRSIDPLKSLDFYMLPKYKDQFNNARSIYKNQLKQYNRLKEKTEADTQRLQDTKERAEKILNKILEETVTDYNAAIRVGVDKQELDKVVRGEKFDKDVTVSILFGLQLGLNDEGGIVVKQNQNQP